MEGPKTNSHPPLEGSERKKKSQDGEKRACGGGNEGGGRGAKLCLGRRRQAGHPGRRRCAPGRAVVAARVRAGGGARCTVTGSCAPRPRGDINWPAGPGSALAPRAEDRSAAAQGPRTVPRFAPSYFGGRWETAGWLLVDGGGVRGLCACGPRSLKTLFHRLFCALTGQPLGILEES